MPNTLAFPLGFLGAAWAGAATAPLNPDYKEEEFAFYLEVGGLAVWWADRVIGCA